MSETSDEILFFLKMHGRATASRLADRLGISPQAVRQQLDRLASDGLVTHADEASGRGRPKRFWALTERGHGRFPDTHAQLTADLLGGIRDEFGDAALDRLIARRERDALESYRRHLATRRTLRARVAALAELRSQEGYMAAWEPQGDGFLLVENHCPICVAAKVCQGFCRSELSVFRSALGPDVRVTRTDHILAGARRCAYKITALDQKESRNRRADHQTAGEDLP